MTGDRRLITRAFVQFLGVIHFFNFYSLAAQVERCIGSTGLLPAREVIESVRNNPNISMFDRLIDCPSFFLWFPDDRWLIGGAWAGVAIAALAAAGFFSRFCFAILFVLYGSYIEIGRELYSFQWDSLILETTFLALLCPCSGLFFRKWERGADKLVTWLMLWLLFRLYIESGIAKLFWGPDTWATLDALRRYYETAPIPTILGWYANSLPDPWHLFGTGATLVIEILGPALIFSSAWVRRFAFVMFSGFQIAILLTANYGIFNYNTLCLHLFLLVDQDADNNPRPSRWMYPIAAVVVFCSIVEFMMLAGGQGVHKTVLPKIDRYVRASHISSKYHLFGPIDPIRYELVFEGTLDHKNWVEYEFPYKAGGLKRPPPFVAPHHPRVDFRLWFERYPLRWQDMGAIPYPDVTASPAALPPYVGRLATQLMDTPALALRHFTGDPLNGEKPVEVRIVFYHYKMTRRGTPESATQYWTRALVGIVHLDPRLGKNGRPMAVPQRTHSIDFY